MVQGTLKRKSNGGASSSKRKKNKLGLAVMKRKRAPAKQVKRLRDKKTTKMLHKNIENLMAAKVMRNDGVLKLSDMRTRGKEQLKVEGRTKKKKRKTKVEAQAKQLENAAARLTRGK